jgi:hypothetical protein
MGLVSSSKNPDPLTQWVFFFLKPRNHPTLVITNYLQIWSQKAESRFQVQFDPKKGFIHRPGSNSAGKSLFLRSNKVMGHAKCTVRLFLRKRPKLCFIDRHFIIN